MAQKDLRRGVFITFEGGEGCGKSTHARLVYGHLRRQGYPCVYTREPGGTRVGEAIRRVILNAGRVDMGPLTELLLFEAARAELVREVIVPALRKKMVVISDRFSDATFAYQGAGGRLGARIVARVDRLARGGLTPDLTVLLDIAPSVGLARARRKKKHDRMEQKRLDYHERVRREYLKLARRAPRRITVVATQRTAAATQALVRREVIRVVQRYTRTG